MEFKWQSLSKIGSIRYKCGYCGLEVGPSFGYIASNNSHKIFICPNCNKPTYLDDDIGTITPGASFGESVDNIPDKDVEELYDEARRCMAKECFTAAVLCCRKLLMNVSVYLGADGNISFNQYVNYLEKNHFIIPSAKQWVDVIRKKGNEATHEIPLITKEDAIMIIKFSEMLLKTIFEYPALAKEE